MTIFEIWLYGMASVMLPIMCAAAWHVGAALGERA